MKKINSWTAVLYSLLTYIFLILFLLFGPYEYQKNGCYFTLYHKYCPHCLHQLNITHTDTTVVDSCGYVLYNCKYEFGDYEYYCPHCGADASQGKGVRHHCGHCQKLLYLVPAEQQNFVKKIHLLNYAKNIIDKQI